MPFGGILSGFFGGLSGHQGAFRSAFLIHFQASARRSFLATSVIISILVDVPRIYVYLNHLSISRGNLFLLISAVVAAFAGSFIASTFIRKMEMRVIQMIVAVLLFSIAVALGAGII